MKEVYPLEGRNIGSSEQLCSTTRKSNTALARRLRGDSLPVPDGEGRLQERLFSKTEEHAQRLEVLSA